MNGNGPERFDTVVVGGGQAGLTAAYHVQRTGRPFVVIDAEARSGDAWRRRWDSLRLFTTARYVGLPGMRFPARGDSFPSKDEMADYLETYAERLALPVEHGVHVDRLWREDGRFQLSAGGRRLQADRVIVATGANRVPRTPAFADRLDPTIVQLHSSAYRNAAQLRDGPVLVVGAGNSGADIALDVVRTHPIRLAGPDTGHVPFRIEKFVARHVGARMVRFAFHHVLTERTPMGRRFHAGHRGGDPLVRVKPADLAAAGVERVGKVTEVRDGQPVLEDGSVLEVTNVIWATGFRRDFSWIDLPAFDEAGEVAHQRGIVPDVAGLGFVGLPFQYAVSSETLMGIDRDARYVVRHLATARTDDPSPTGAQRRARTSVT